MTDAIDRWIEDTDPQKRVQSNALNTSVPADQVAKDYLLAQEIGTEPAWVSQFRDSAESAKAFQRAKRAAAVPGLGDWLAEPDNYAVAHDDLDHLEWWQTMAPTGNAQIGAGMLDLLKRPKPVKPVSMAATGASVGVMAAVAGPIAGEKLAQDYRYAGEKLAQDYRYSQHQNELAMLRLRDNPVYQSLGMKPLSEKEQYRRLVLSGEKQPDGRIPFFSPAVRQLPNLANRITMPFEMAAKGAEAGFKLQTAAGRIGREKAGAVGELSGWTVAGMAPILGATSGFQLGLIAPTFVPEAGGYLDEVSRLRGEDGQAIDPHTAGVASLMVGGFNTAIELGSDAAIAAAFGFGGPAAAVKGKAAKAAAKAAIKGAVTEALTRLTTKEAFKRAAIEVGKNVAVQNGEELLQESATMAAVQLSKEVTGGRWKDASVEDVMQRYADIIIETTQASLVFGSLGAGVHLVADAQHIAEADKAEAMMEEMGRQSSMSKLRERMPKKYAEVVQQIHDANGGPISVMPIDADKFAEYWQSQGIDPVELAAELGIQGDTLQQALDAGGVVEIPIGEYAAKIAPIPQHHAAMFNNARILRDGLTNNQVRAMEKEGDQWIRAREQVIRETDNRADLYSSENRVRESIRREFEGSKAYAPEVSRQMVDLHVALWTVTAHRVGSDPWTEYSKRPLTIRNRMAGQELGVDLAQDYVNVNSPISETMRAYMLDRAADMGSADIAADWDKNTSQTVKTTIHRARRIVKMRLEAGQTKEQIAQSIYVTPDVIDALLADRPSGAKPSIAVHVERLMAKGLTNEQMAERINSMGYETNKNSVKVIKSTINKRRRELGEQLYQADGSSYISVGISREPVEVIHNPELSHLRSILRRQLREAERGNRLYGPSIRWAKVDGEVYAWDGGAATHNDVAEKLSLTIDEDAKGEVNSSAELEDLRNVIGHSELFQDGSYGQDRFEDDQSGYRQAVRRAREVLGWEAPDWLRFGEDQGDPEAVLGGLTEDRVRKLNILKPILDASRIQIQSIKKLGKRSFGAYQAVLDLPVGYDPSWESVILGGVEHAYFDTGEEFSHPDNTVQFDVSRAGDINIRWSRVDERLRGGGVGAFLYRQVLDWAHNEGRRTFSDKLLSPDSQHMYMWALPSYGYEVSLVGKKGDLVFDSNGWVSSRSGRPIYEVKRGPDMKLYAHAPMRGLTIDGPKLADMVNDELYQGPIFYSALQRAVETSKQAKAPASQWKAMLTKTPGIKKEEIEYSGLFDWLDMQDGAITKEAIAAYLDENGVRVEEVVKQQTQPVNKKELARQRFDEEWSRNNSDLRAAFLFDAVGERAREQFPKLSAEQQDIYGDYKELASEARRNLSLLFTPQEIQDFKEEAWSQFRDDYTESAEEEVAQIQYENDDETKWSSYTLPGGENYREVLLTLPLNQRPGAEDYLRAYRQKFPNATTTDDEVRRFHNQGVPLPGEGTGFQRVETTGDVYRSSHWSEPNVLAHVRFDERTDADGKRTLLVHEFQSDWHQAGREKGYKLPDADATLMGARARRDETYAHIQRLIRDGKRHLGAIGKMDWRYENAQISAEEMRNLLRKVPDDVEAANLEAEIEQAQAAHDIAKDDLERARLAAITNVPDAPFKNNAWASLAMKRMIRFAAENGFDEIAWNAGEYPAERFSLDKQVDRIEVEPYGSTPDLFAVFVWDKSGRKIVDDDQFSGAKLAETFGSEMAERIKQAPKDQTTTFAGDGLKVGGEGMRTFYNKILPNIANDLGKKYGARVERATIQTPAGQDGMATVEAGPKNIHSLPITESLRAAALEGQPLFQQAKAALAIPNFMTGLKAGEMAMIKMGEASDISSFLHEFGHYALAVYQSIADEDGAPKAIVDDMAAIREWLASDKSIGRIAREASKGAGRTISIAEARKQLALGSKMTDRDVWRASHEMFARTFEAYLMEGRAPSLALSKAFAAFKAWLSQIYKSILRLDANLTPEIRDVMDRMLATDEQIKEVRAVEQMGLMTREQFPGTDKQWERYQLVGARAAQEAEEELRSVIMDAYVKQQTASWAREKARMRKTVERDIDESKERRAFEWLAFGRWKGETPRKDGKEGTVWGNAEPPEGLQPMRINTGDVLDDYGREALDGLPKALKPWDKDAGKELVDEARRISKMLRKKRPKSLIQAIREKGGIRDTNGDLIAMIGTKQASPGLIKDDGYDPDDMALAMWEEGYFGPGPGRGFELGQGPTEQDEMKALEARWAADESGDLLQSSGGRDRKSTKARDYLLARNDGMKIPDIAAEFDVEISNVKASLSNLRTRLKKKIAEGSSIEAEAQALNVSPNEIELFLETKKGGRERDKLDRVLSIIKSDPFLSNAAIARRIGSTPELVSGMLTTLRKEGHEIPLGRYGASELYQSHDYTNRTSGIAIIPQLDAVLRWVGRHMPEIVDDRPSMREAFNGDLAIAQRGPRGDIWTPAKIDLAKAYYDRELARPAGTESLDYKAAQKGVRAAELGVLVEQRNRDRAMFGGDELYQLATIPKIKTRTEGEQIYFDVAGGGIRARAQSNNRVLKVDASGLDEGKRGVGVGVAVYEAAFEKAKKMGRIMVSDQTVSDDASNVYAALARRGYRVLRAETTSRMGPYRQAGGMGGPVFAVLDADDNRDWADVMAAYDGMPRELYDGYAGEAVELPAMPADQVRALPREQWDELFQLDGRPSINDLLDAIRQEHSGTPVYSQHDDDLIAELNYWQEQADWLRNHGIEPDSNAETLREQVQAYLDKINENAVHPEIAASVFGFDSGEALIKALSAIKPRREAIEEEVNRRMREEYGDPLNDGTIAEEARLAAHSAAQARQIEIEIETLNRAAGKGVASAMAKDIAFRQLQKMTLKQIRNSEWFLQAERRAAAAAIVALESGDEREAAFHKQRQLLNFWLYRHARDEAKKIDRAEQRMRDLSNKQSIRDKIDPDYMGRIDALLDGYEIRKSLQGPKAQWNNQELLAWVAEMEANGMGHLVAVDPAIIANAKRRPISALTLEEFQGLKDTIANLEHLGRLKDKLLAAQDKRRFEQVVDDMVASIKANGPVSKRKAKSFSPTDLEKPLLFAREAHAQLTKPEFLFRLMDGQKDNGAVWRAMFLPFAQAEDVETRLMSDITAKIKAAFDRYTSQERGRLFTVRYDMPLLATKDGGQSYTKAELLSLALNWGNAGNRQAVLDGYQWTEENVDTSLARLSEKDWQVVQDIWAAIDSLRPAAFQLTKDLTGIEPVKVEPMTVRTRFGDIQGGYYPLAWDYSRNEIAFKRDEERRTKELFGGNHVKPMTRNGSMIERKGSAGLPVRLSLDVLTSHAQDVVHMIAFRRAVIDADRLLSNPRVQQAFIDSVGREQYRQLRPWLQSIAADRVDPSSFWVKALLKVRNNASIVAMGFRIGTSVQQLTGLMNAIPRVGVGPMASAIAKIYAKPWETAKWWGFIRTRSEFMRHRKTNMDRDIRDAMNSMKDGPVDKVRRMAFIMVGEMDFVVSSAAWIAAYENARGGKLQNIDPTDEAAAIAHADSVVRTTQSSGAPKDLPTFMRGHEANKLFTMFYSFFSVLYNQLTNEQIAGVFGKKIGKAEFAANMFMILFAAPILAEALAGRLLPREGEDDDDVKKRLMATIGMFPFQAIPGVRDIVNAFGTPFDYQLSPIGSSISTVVKAAKGASDGDISSQFEQKQLVTALGVIFGLPAGQAYVTGDYVRDVAEGTEDPMANPDRIVTEGLLRDTR